MKTQNCLFLTLLVLAGCTIVSCKKQDKVILPPVQAYTPYFISSSTATIGFRVENDGGSKILDCGIYLDVSANPETTGTKLSVASDTGTFVFQVNGLIGGKQFYMKAFAKNSKGEGLSDQVTFTSPATIKDYDNNSYETVSIGNQIWMAENLKATHYLNGDPIGTTATATLDISGESSPKYQWAYAGDEANTPVYGKLYTYNAITDSRKVCPTGWHIPSDAEWITLENSLGGYLIAGSGLKETGNTHWLAPYNLDATNVSCFKALPGGYRNSAAGSNTFSLLGNYGYFWTSTEADGTNGWIRSLYVQSSQLTRINFSKKGGASVRCLKD